MEIQEEKIESLRTLNCEMNNISNADGSAIFMQGDTTVIAGVYGPVEGKSHKTYYDRANVEVVYSAANGPSSINDRLIELYIHDIYKTAIFCSLHPRATISINIQELQDSGGLLACAFNAACLALINSSLSMKYTVAAINCMIERETGNYIIDPNIEQLKKARATFTLAFDSLKKDLVSCHTSGHYSVNEFMKAVNKCKESSTHIFDFYRNLVTKYAKLI